MFELATARAPTVRPNGPNPLVQAVVDRRGLSAPEDLTAMMVLATSVRLTWRPPSDVADGVTGYVVYWQEDSLQRYISRVFVTVRKVT